MRVRDDRGRDRRCPRDAVHPPPARRPDTTGNLAEAVAGALADAGIDHGAVDGLGVASFSLVPDHAIDLAWRLGLHVRWLMDDANGGASAVNLLHHAVRAIEAGDAETIVLCSGDHLDRAAFRRLVEEYNRATAEGLTPLGYPGPNPLFAMVTQRSLAARARARRSAHPGRPAQVGVGNPGAVYREPLTLEDYLASPFVAEPLTRYDCVPVVTGADAIVVTASPAGAGRTCGCARSPRCTTPTTSRATASAGLRRRRVPAVAPRRRESRGRHAAFLYDDYPVMSPSRPRSSASSRRRRRPVAAARRARAPLAVEHVAGSSRPARPAPRAGCTASSRRSVSSAATRRAPGRCLPGPRRRLRDGPLPPRRLPQRRGPRTGRRPGGRAPAPAPARVHGADPAGRVRRRAEHAARSAVAPAGGIGMVGGALAGADVLGYAIAEIRASSRGAVGVNFVVPFFDVAEHRAALEVAAAGADLVEFFYADPDPALIAVVHEGGARAGWQVGSAEARRRGRGVDVVALQGVEAGGHVRATAGLLPMLAAVLDAVDVPVIAAGGIATPRAMAAVLAAGAAGVRMGTRFVASPSRTSTSATRPRSSPPRPATRSSPALRRAVADAPHRVLRSAIEAAGPSPSRSSARCPRARPASTCPASPGSRRSPTRGRHPAMALFAGEGVGEIAEILPAGDIVRLFATGRRPSSAAALLTPHGPVGEDLHISPVICSMASAATALRRVPLRALWAVPPGPRRRCASAAAGSSSTRKPAPDGVLEDATPTATRRASRSRWAPCAPPPARWSWRGWSGARPGSVVALRMRRRRPRGPAAPQEGGGVSFLTTPTCASASATAAGQPRLRARPRLEAVAPALGSGGGAPRAPAPRRRLRPPRDGRVRQAELGVHVPGARRRPRAFLLDGWSSTT